MAFRLAYPEQHSLPSKLTQPVRRRDYLSFIHELPCVVSGVRPVQAAHISTANPIYGHFGRAKGRKAADRWVLPLSEPEHRRQHSMSEETYWQSVGVNPYIIALVLFGLWSDIGDEAEEVATRFLVCMRRSS